MATLRTSAWTLAALGVTTIALAACGKDDSSPSDGTATPAGTGTTGPTTGAPSTDEQIKQVLDQRKVDYGEALRTASFKLRDQLPSLDEINSVGNAGDVNAQKPIYEGLIDKMIDSPQFAKVMVKFWKDTFRTGQTGTAPPAAGMPNLDMAANFAAQVTVEGRSYTELFTASANTCPTFDPASSAFTAASCPPGANPGPTAGVLTDPGLLAQYFANLAFRRVREFQETFACQKFPAALKEGVPMGNGTYTGTYDFNSIMGKANNPKARVDFQETTAVVCANCHVDLNHIAPLFINYDDKGVLQTTPQVEVPIAGTPKAALTDYLPAGEGTSWRAGKPAADIPALGQQMAADPQVTACAVNRVWNYAMSRGDIVNDLAAVPDAVTANYVKDFAANGQKLKETIRAVFKSEDFTKF